MIAEPLLRMATAMASPGGGGGRLSTFIFHRVLAEPDPLLAEEPDARRFDELLRWIGGQFRVLPPLEACERLRSGSLPPRAAAITFDDGYRDNHDVALPLLRRHGMQAAFFVATGFLNGGAMFNDRVIEAVRGAGEHVADLGWLGLGELRLGSVENARAAIARLLPAVKRLPLAERDRAVARLEEQLGASGSTDLMMSDAQVKALHAAGMAIGGHTRTHPILKVLDDRAAREEIVGGAEDLRAITGEAPALFAYPNGRPGEDFDERHAPMVKEAGFRFAFTTRPGVAVPDTDPYQLPRFTPWDRSAMRFQARMLRNLFEKVRA